MVRQRHSSDRGFDYKTCRLRIVRREVVMIGLTRDPKTGTDPDDARKERIAKPMLIGVHAAVSRCGNKRIKTDGYPGIMDIFRKGFAQCRCNRYVSGGHRISRIEIG